MQKGKVDCFWVEVSDKIYKGPSPKKVLLIVLMTIFSLQIFAKGIAQSLTFKADNVSVEKVFNIIEKKYNYNFVYTSSVLKNTVKVSLNVVNASITEVLDEMFKMQPLTYSIVDKVIIIKQKQLTATTTQAEIIKGRVVDEAGNPLSDVTVMFKTSAIGVKTDDNGNFEFPDVPVNTVLSISSVGYVYQEVIVKDKSFLLITLKKIDALLMDEVVVVNTGYQKVKKEQLTGAVASMGRQAIDQRVNVTGNLMESMEGKIAGLVYNPNSGREVSIRGVSTFDAVQKPLIVLDGFPTELTLDAINPNDVVSISVLKDAASAAIYGVRASNGIIVITTRRGVAGKMKFSARAMGSYQPTNNVNDLNYLTGKGFVDVEKANAALETRLPYDYANRPVSPIYDLVFLLKEGKITAAQAQAGFDKYAAIDNSQQYMNLFYKNAFSQQYDFDFSGGNDKATYLTSVNHLRTEGNTFGNNSNRTILSFKGNYHFTDKLKLDFVSDYTNSRSKSTTIPAFSFFKPYELFQDDAGNALSSIMQPMDPNFQNRSISQAANTANISKGLLDMLYYPADEIHNRNVSDVNNQLRIQAMFNTKLYKGIDLDLGGSYELAYGNQEDYASVKSFSTRFLINQFTSKDDAGNTKFNLPIGDIMGMKNTKSNFYTGRVQLNIDKKLDENHQINFIAGSEIRRTLYTGSFNKLYGYNVNTMFDKPVNFAMLSSYESPFYNTIGAGVNIGISDRDHSYRIYNDSRFVSYYGNGIYIFRDKYIATGSIRLDKSDLFGTDPRYRNKVLWSAGLAWRMKEENFLANVNWLDDLKLRASYGENGNVSTTSGPFLKMEMYQSSFIPNKDLASRVLTPPNKALRWEMTKNTNIGLDFALLSHKVNGSVDYYKKLSVDLLADYDMDPTSGFNTSVINSGTMVNHGLEFNVTTHNIVKPNFRWSSQFTGSFNHNKILAVKDKAIEKSYQLLDPGKKVGYPMNALFAYKYAGLSNTGQPLVYDEAGKKILLSYYGGVDVTSGSLYYAGTTIPKYVLGVNNQLSYRQFDVSFLFMYYGGHIMRLRAPNAMDTRPVVGAENFWQKAGDENTTYVPGVSAYGKPGYYDFAATYGYTSSDKFIAKADYIRLRDLIFTYNINDKVSGKIGMNNVKLRFQIQNLYMHTFGGKNLNPETADLSTGSSSFKLKPTFTFAIYTNF